MNSVKFVICRRFNTIPNELSKSIICLCLLLPICLPFAGCSHELSYEQIREWGDDLAADPLIDALKSKDWRIRQEAANNLGRIRDPKAMDPLVAVLQDDDWRVQLAAVNALGQIGDAKARGPLEGFLKNSSNFRIREATEKALAKIQKK